MDSNETMFPAALFYDFAYVKGHRKHRVWMFWNILCSLCAKIS